MISLRSHRMLFAAFCVVLATTDAHDDHELRTFHNLSFTNPGIGRDYSKNDIVDKLSFNLYDGETLINKKKAISLFVLDPEEQVWVAASFKISRKPDAQGRLELRKPLVGYEMETESACKKRGLTKLPYVKNRWGENSCSKYMMDGMCEYCEISFKLKILQSRDLIASCGLLTSLKTLQSGKTFVNFKLNLPKLQVLTRDLESVTWWSLKSLPPLWNWSYRKAAT